MMRCARKKTGTGHAIEGGDKGDEGACQVPVRCAGGATLDNPPHRLCFVACFSFQVPCLLGQVCWNPRQLRRLGSRYRVGN